MADNNALERDTIDSSNEAIAFAEAHQTLVDDLKPNTSAECKVRIIEYPKKSLPDIGDTALSLQPLSASLEATRDFVGKSHDLPNETNSASDNASKHFKTSADTNATKSRTGTVTVGCCGSTKLLIADWGASKAASVSEVEASDCSGFNGEADHSGTTTGEGATKGKIFEDSSSLTSRPVIAGIDSEMLDLDYNAPKLRVPRTTKDVKLHPLPATTENSLTQEKPTKEPPVDKQLGVCSSTCTKMSNRKDEAETFERCGMERNLRKSDVSTSTGNLSVLHARKGKDVAVAGSSKNSEARHILHSLGSSMGSEVEPDAGLRHSQKSLSVHSFIAAEASESDAEESDKGHVQVEDATRRGAQTKTSKPNNSVKEQSNLTRRTRRIQPEGSTQDSNRAQPDSITTTKVSSDGRHRVASHHTAPRLERNLSNELQLLSRQNIPSKLDEATYSENALFDNSIILHQHRDAFADSDNDFEQATAKGMWKSQKDGDSTINKRLHKSPSGLEVETDKNAFHSVDMPSHGSMTAGMTLEIPNNEGNSTFVPLNDTGGESDSSFEDVFKKTKKKCRRDLKATRKEADDESLDRSLSPQMKSNEIAINTKPSDASISTELDHGTNSCNEHSKISSYDVDTDGFCTKSKRTSKPGLKKAKSSKKRRIKPENKPPADLEQISEDQDLPDWRARPAQRSGIFGIAGSICSPRMLDTNVLDTPQESSVSQERIVIPRDPKKKLSRQGLKNEEEVIEESREDAKQLKDEASSSGDSMFEFFNLLNLDPWRDNANKLDEEKITKIMRKHPQYCGKTYKFESFDGRILPLAALCALRATLSTIEVCFHAYETAGMMMDKMVGTPLHYASAYKASLEVVKYLVKIQPGSLRKRNQAERLPLHM